MEPSRHSARCTASNEAYLERGDTLGSGGPRLGQLVGLVAWHHGLAAALTRQPLRPALLLQLLHSRPQPARLDLSALNGDSIRGCALVACLL